MIPAGFGFEAAPPGRTGTTIRSNPVSELGRWSNKPTLHSLCIVPTVVPLAKDHDAQEKPPKHIEEAKSNPRADAIFRVPHVLEATMPKTCCPETAIEAEINCSQNRD
jgi:hypothetical protein